MSLTIDDRRADQIAARATGCGIGLIVFMVVWTLGARIAERLVDAPTSAYIAMAVALIAGVVTTVRAGRRLDATTDRVEIID
jgi:di/tricarboxylate transporter